MISNSIKCMTNTNYVETLFFYKLKTELKNFGLKNKKLKYRDKWNTLRELEVDFSYPEKTELPQMGLF